MLLDEHHELIHLIAELPKTWTFSQLESNDIADMHTFLNKQNGHNNIHFSLMCELRITSLFFIFLFGEVNSRLLFRFVLHTRASCVVLNQ